jgi:hypothetical protein
MCDVAVSWMEWSQRSWRDEDCSDTLVFGVDLLASLSLPVVPPPAEGTHDRDRKNAFQRNL